jgi:hypothetical protein
MRLAGTITVGDDEVDVTGYAWREENERGTGVVVLLDAPHDLTPYASDAEDELARVFESIELDGRIAADVGRGASW